MNCSKCGFALEDGAKFCPKCGERVAGGGQGATCPHCAAELKSGAKFCPTCGCALGGAAQPQQGAPQPGDEPIQVPAVVADVTELSAPSAPPQEGAAAQGVPKKLKLDKKLVIGAVAAVTALLIIVAVMVFGGKGCSSYGGALPNEPAELEAELGKDSGAYLPLPDGSSLEIKGDVTSAKLTPDGQHVVVHEDYDEIYVTDAKGENKTTVNDHCVAILALTNEGFIYTKRESGDGDYDYHRYLFNPGKDQKTDYKLGDLDNYVIAGRTLSLAFIPEEDDDELYLLPHDTDVPVKVDNVTSQTEILAVNDAGSTVLWNEYSSEGGTQYELIKCNERDGVKELHTFESELDYIDGYYSGYGLFRTYVSGHYSSPYGRSFASFNSGDMCYVYNNGAEEIVLKAAGGEPVEAGVSGTFGGIFTSRCAFARDTCTSADGVYVLTTDNADDFNGNLYYISMKDGSETKIRSEVYSAFVSNGTLAYTVGEYGDNELYVTSCAAAKTEEGEEVDDDIRFVLLSDSGRQLFYCKDYSALKGTADLFSYTLGADSSVAVASDVSALSSSFIALSKDGKTVFYCDDISSGTLATGSLCSWTVGAKEPVKICDDVLAKYSGFKNALKYGVSCDSFYFYQNPRSGSVRYADLMVLRNGAVQTVAEDVRVASED